jgi:hypothetical protein
MLRLERLCDKNWGLTGVMTEDVLNNVMSLTKLNPFHQSGTIGKWCFVEFWTNNEELILEEVLKTFPDISL